MYLSCVTDKPRWIFSKILKENQKIALWSKVVNKWNHLFNSLCFGKLFIPPSPENRSTLSKITEVPCVTIINIHREGRAGAGHLAGGGCCFLKEFTSQERRCTSELKKSWSTTWHDVLMPQAAFMEALVRVAHVGGPSRWERNTFSSLRTRSYTLCPRFN